MNNFCSTQLVGPWRSFNHKGIMCESNQFVKSCIRWCSWSIPCQFHIVTIFTRALDRVRYSVLNFDCLDGFKSDCYSVISYNIQICNIIKVHHNERFLIKKWNWRTTSQWFYSNWIERNNNTTTLRWGSKIGKINLLLVRYYIFKACLSLKWRNNGDFFCGTFVVEFYCERFSWNRFIVVFRALRILNKFNFVINLIEAYSI